MKTSNKQSKKTSSNINWMSTPTLRPCGMAIDSGDVARIRNAYVNLLSKNLISGYDLAVMDNDGAKYFHHEACEMAGIAPHGFVLAL